MFDIFSGLLLQDAGTHHHQGDEDEVIVVAGGFDNYSWECCEILLIRKFSVASWYHAPLQCLHSSLKHLKNKQSILKSMLLFSGKGTTVRAEAKSALSLYNVC